MNTFGPTNEREGPRVYTVKALTREIRDLLEDHFDFVWVEAEISNFRSPASGHYYMVLKDEEAQIRAVMFRPQARYLKFTPEDGMKVISQGRIGVYEPRGEYQIILDYIEPLGIGALALAFEQLKQKLAAQGIFDEDVKRPLPDLPQKVAVITSPTGAAIRDFLQIIQRRFANIEITIVPVKVQGDGAADEMVEALKRVNRETNVDVIVLTRGGGSLEDLWAFNDEKLALAIRESSIPVVSAVGHEIDITISDLAADLRAPTPSAAAELIVAEKESLIERLMNSRNRLLSAFSSCLAYQKQKLRLLSKQVKDPRKRLSDLWMKLDERNDRLIRMIGLILKERKGKLARENRALKTHSPGQSLRGLREGLDLKKRALFHSIVRRFREMKTGISSLEDRIRDLSPQSVLERGYSITKKLPENRILRDSAETAEMDRIQVILAKGELECSVNKVFIAEK